MDGNISRINGQNPYVPNTTQSHPDIEKSGEEGTASPGDTFEKKETPEAAKGSKSHKKSKKSPEQKEYTILAYEAAANNLEPYMVGDVKEMESCPSSEHYNLAVQLSRYEVSDLTQGFFAQALSKAFGSRDFKASLQEFVPDAEMVEKYGELLKDPYVTNRVALILLRRNPALLERIDKLVDSKVKEASEENKSLAQVLEETTKEMLSQIKTNESEKEKQKIAESLAAAGQEQQTVESMSAAGQDLTKIFAGDDFNLGDAMVRVTGNLIRGVEGISPDGAGLHSKGDLNLAEILGGRRDSILFVDSTPNADIRSKQGDYSGYLGWADGVEINNEPLWRGVKRYGITHDDDPTRINSEPLANLGFEDMSKVKSLADFIIWGMKKFPAKHYVVTLSNHGAGFLGAEEERGNMLSLANIREAFDMVKQKTGKTPDIIAFDACLMSQAEVAYELRDSAKYLVASEEVVGGDGYPYKDLFPAIDKSISEGKKDPRDIASVFVDEGKKVNDKSTTTLAALDLSAINEVVKGADQLAAHILEGKAKIEDVRATLKETQHFNARGGPMPPYDDFRDLGDFVAKLDKNPNITDPAIKEDIKNLKEALQKVVVKEEHLDDEDYQGSTGLSIYAPRRKKNMSIPLMEEYEKTTMAQDTKWGELVKKLTDYEELLKEAAGEGEEKKPKLTFVPLPNRPA